MKIVIDYEDGTTPLEIKTDNDMTNTLNSKYPEVTMMTAMEELNELGIAISKCIRNGDNDKLNNLAEEIVDVLTAIQWAINRFNITPASIKEWISHKSSRLAYRSINDTAIFRSEEAKDNYNKNRITNSNDSLTITKGSNSRYEVSGDIHNIPEYYHVLKTHMNTAYFNSLISSEDSDSKDSFIDEYEEESKLSKKDAKKLSKDLNKILDKASKNVKHVDKAKKRKKGK